MGVQMKFLMQFYKKKIFFWSDFTQKHIVIMLLWLRNTLSHNWAKRFCKEGKTCEFFCLFFVLF